MINLNSQQRNVKDEEILIPWFAVIGMLVMKWSAVERNIDQCVHILFKKTCTNKASTRKPNRLNSKLDFIKQNIPDGIIELSRLETLLATTKATVRIRDVCVHGVIDRYDENIIVFGKVDGKSVDHIVENFTIDYVRLEKYATSISVIQEEWTILFQDLYNSENGSSRD